MDKTKNGKINFIFDYYETALKDAQNIIKHLKDKKEYVDISNGSENYSIKSSDGVILVINVLNRVSIIPNTDDEIIFLSGAKITSDGYVAHTSNCHGGIMKRYEGLMNMITQFNSEVKCKGFKIKTILKQDGTVIELGY